MKEDLRDLAARVVLVGPLPPPVGGASISFESFVGAWRNHIGQPAALLDTAPSYLKTSHELRFSDITRGIGVAWRMLRAAKQGRVLLVFATFGFFRRYARYLKWLQSWRNVEVVVSFFGGSLHDKLSQLPQAKRTRYTLLLNEYAGVIVETVQIQKGLAELGVSRVVPIPGYRGIEWNELPDIQFGESNPLRLVYLSHVRREKGILELLRALELLEAEGADVTCDIYGPIAPDVEDDFETLLMNSGTARYCGTATGSIPGLLTQYDLFVLPTWHEHEGHPGVVIECMVAGIPVLATRHRALPELIEDGVNGLLVERRSPTALAEALRRLENSREKLTQMGRAHRERLWRHDVKRAAEQVCERVLTISGDPGDPACRPWTKLSSGGAPG